MTKEDIIKAVWNELPSLTVNEARKVYETSVDLIKDRLSKGEDVELRRFGTFKVREKNKRIGRNPKNGKEAEINERRVVTFKASKILKDIVIGDKKLSE